MAPRTEIVHRTDRHVAASAGYAPARQRWPVRATDTRAPAAPVKDLYRDALPIAVLRQSSSPPFERVATWVRPMRNDVFRVQWVLGNLAAGTRLVVSPWVGALRAPDLPHAYSHHFLLTNVAPQGAPTAAPQDDLRAPPYRAASCASSTCRCSRWYLYSLMGLRRMCLSSPGPQQMSSVLWGRDS
jgi:hypothetical protein